MSVLDYGDNRAITAMANWMMPQSFGFRMGFRIALEQAAFVLDSQAETTLKVYPSDGEPFAPELNKGNGYKGEIEYFTGLISGTNADTIITPEQARESVRMALEVTKT